MTENKEVILSKEYYEKLKDELEFLKTKRRPEIAEKIKVARAFGDLSENAEYDEAKNEQAEVEERIAKVENMIRNAKTIEEDTSSDVVSLGKIVKIHDEKYNEDLEYKIVGTAEASPFDGRISNESPVGSALLGAKIGQTVETETPQGILKYTVLEIK
ncbi:MAG: transcription elongation factor GreA [Peptoniphilaceae bacterium]|nr:transcription elongation factor GreA [Peptoniphilaceae bacterium]MDD7383338.1 transcription elongation factor GreA [Peptoniphilaceae bacterium]MDY3738291.1 transcription elongation factor GreA [Peptoniphilaceae bacterium]